MSDRLLADKGTIFLDEIGELPLHLQPKLLNVLQSAVFERIGGTAHIKVDVRIVAATNRDLEAEIHKSRFRADLFYRLNAFPIYIPPLRKRRDDIPDLACHFLSLASKNVGRTFEGITNADMERLQSYSWPGNIRELRHVIERSAILSPDDGFRVTIPSRQAAQTSAASELRSLEEVERDHIIQVLEGCGWKVSGPYGAARILGLKRTTLVSRMKKLGIERPGANNQSSVVDHG
ncbi:MAG: sigma 54-interacting transcriptional regulator [Thermodesulfobacteriota bacterium]|nr:sigma 54-interacting transcriptional regulator [Thermodesulfobacteriota bacterium]